MASANSLPLPFDIDEAWRKLLIQWANDGSLEVAAREAFHLGQSPLALQLLNSRWAEGDFWSLPPIELISGIAMPGAAGAYAASTGTIYLNEEWLASATQEQALTVLTEELGHHLDALLNVNDTPGDEGLTFVRLLLGNKISHERSTESDDAILLKIESGVIAEAALIVGDSGNDTIYGGNDADTLKGLGGNDEIHGGDGDDNIEGGDGDDIIRGESGNDVIIGGNGIDEIFGGNGDDNISDTGNSTIYGEGGSDIIYSRKDQNTYGSEQGLTVFGGDGDDQIYNYYGSFKKVDAGSGDDTVYAEALGSEQAILLGGEGYDKLTVRWISNSINWSLITGFEELYFGDHGGSANIVFPNSFGQSGTTLKIRSNAWSHPLVLDFSAELDASLDITGVDGYSPNDVLKGGFLGDFIRSLGGDDTVYGGGGNDILDLGDGADIATGGQGGDFQESCHSLAAI